MRSKLSFTFIANACGIFTGKDGTRILCDPWLVDGVFEGSWCHYPKIATTPADVKDVDAIYVSHLHPDHFDERYFDFDRAKPIIVLDHGQNYLPKKLRALGYTNLMMIGDGQTARFREFELTMFAPFAKHNFHDAKVGNLIDSGMLIACDGVSALNTNDNTPTIEAARRLRERFGEITLAMLNYNAAGPYPSCFDNLSEAEKVSEHERVLGRNLKHMKDVLGALKPRFALPFAGAYVLGGEQRRKNKYLGTTTWDHCARWLNDAGVAPTEVLLLRETDTFDLETGRADRPYVPIDTAAMERYIETELAKIVYPHQRDPVPDEATLIGDVKKAATAMRERMRRFDINSAFTVILSIFGKPYAIYPGFQLIEEPDRIDKRLECRLDERLLRRILDRDAYWNNAEIGAHIDFVRVPNDYEPDLHMGLQFFHL